MVSSCRSTPNSTTPPPRTLPTATDSEEQKEESVQCQHQQVGDGHECAEKSRSTNSDTELAATGLLLKRKQGRRYEFTAPSDLTSRLAELQDAE
jgi:hypothetical protein